jgi:hypothetical protein
MNEQQTIKFLLDVGYTLDKLKVKGKSKVVPVL